MKKPLKTSKKCNNCVNFATFSSRAMAFMTDIFMIGIPISIIAMVLFGYDQVNSAGAMDVIMQTQKAKEHAPSPVASIVQISLSALVYIGFWYHSGETPGKKMMGIKVVDATTYKRASLIQLILRYVGYFISAITLVGFLLPLMRKDKRALHDLLSSTAVIHA